jgi:hypothetical protein
MYLTWTVCADSGKEVPSQARVGIFYFPSVPSKEYGSGSVSITYSYYIAFIEWHTIRFTLKGVIEHLASVVAEIAHRMFIPA